MVGFFTSAVLAELAPGLATYVESTRHSFRLIISPFLHPDDQAAIEVGNRSAEDIAEALLDDLTITEDLLEQHALRCLSYLLRRERIEIRIALMKDALFHPKVWIFTQSEHSMAAHGSSNLTLAGIRKNFEQISISRSWEDPNQRFTVNKLQEQFERLWADEEDDCKVIMVSHAIKQRIIRSYPAEIPPNEEDFRALYDKARGLSEAPHGPEPQSPMAFRIPGWLQYEEGEFEHQGRAVAAWYDSGCRGVLEMATGSGKTITAMICAYRLHQPDKPLLIVVAAPYVPLIEQWCDEIEPFGIKPVNLTTARNATKRASELQKLKRRLRIGLSDVEAIVVSHDTLCTPEFLTAVEAFDCTRLLIADEVHNLGRPSFVNDPPEFFEYRLGLSAKARSS